MDTIDTIIVPALLTLVMLVGVTALVLGWSDFKEVSITLFKRIRLNRKSARKSNYQADSSQ